MDSTEWLNEKNCYNISRRITIWKFTVKGLIPFLKSHGYVFNVHPKHISTGIATLLFHNKGHTLLVPMHIQRNDDYSIEHKQHYNHVIDESEWNILWNDWSFWDDVSLDYPHGTYRRMDIQEYCWSQIDLDSSEQTRIVEEFIDGGESSVFHEDYED